MGKRAMSAQSIDSTTSSDDGLLKLRRRRKKKGQTNKRDETYGQAQQRWLHESVKPPARNDVFEFIAESKLNSESTRTLHTRLERALSRTALPSETNTHRSHSSTRSTSRSTPPVDPLKRQ